MNCFKKLLKYLNNKPLQNNTKETEYQQLHIPKLMEIYRNVTELNANL